jgi:phosphoribosylformylglycinamidine (FGAM) synthase-like enzyme
MVMADTIGARWRRRRRARARHAKALAATCDCTPRYVKADPVAGGASGRGGSLAQPDRRRRDAARHHRQHELRQSGTPARSWGSSSARKGMAMACKALDFPVVSGNVSLYNETNGQAILPTPVIGGVGLIEDFSKAAGIGIDRDGLDIVLVGGFGSHLGQSAYLRDIIGKVDGPPPPVDLDAERKNGEAVRSAILQGKAAACHDISSGGLLVALAEMCLAGGVGATVSLSGDAPTHAQAFGEDQGRYLIATSDGDALAGAMIDAGLTADVIGFTGGESVTVNDIGSVALADLRQAHEGWLPGYMSL